MADTDRAYVSQYSQETVGLAINVASVATDADATVTAVVTNEDTQQQLFTRAATHAGTGLYQLDLTPDDTAVLGNYVVQWSFALSGAQKAFYTFLAIGGAQPAYDSLSSDLKIIVDQVWVRFADLFDSPSGGPNLQTYLQTNWSRGRMAQMLGMAMRRINTVAQPPTTFSVDGGGDVFPTRQWGPLLEQATYVECLKHLRRSYVEQPEYQGASISRLDRRDYMDRWSQILADEEALMRPQLDIFKISQMGLGRPAILVSGGIYGRYSPVNYPGMAGRPRMFNANFF